MLNTAEVRGSRPMFGEIWMCNLTTNERSVQTGYRPVFILSNNKNNTFSPTVNIIPLTSKMNKRKLPVHVELWDHKRYGLPVPSTMMIEQVTTVSYDSLDKRIGKVGDSETLRSIRHALSIQFPILSVC